MQVNNISNNSFKGILCASGTYNDFKFATAEISRKVSLTPNNNPRICSLMYNISKKTGEADFLIVTENQADILAKAFSPESNRRFNFKCSTFDLIEIINNYFFKLPDKKLDLKDVCESIRNGKFDFVRMRDKK